MRRICLTLTLICEVMFAVGVDGGFGLGRLRARLADGDESRWIDDKHVERILADLDEWDAVAPDERYKYEPEWRAARRLDPDNAGARKRSAEMTPERAQARSNWMSNDAIMRSEPGRKFIVIPDCSLTASQRRSGLTIFPTFGANHS